MLWFKIVIALIYYKVVKRKCAKMARVCLHYIANEIELALPLMQWYLAFKLNAFSHNGVYRILIKVKTLSNHGQRE